MRGFALSLKPRKREALSGALRQFCPRSRLSLRSAGISDNTSLKPRKREALSGALRQFCTRSRLSLRSAGISVLLAPALLLSGCFTSDVELIGAREARRAMPPGEYTHTPFDTDGNEWGGVTWQGRIEYGFFSRRYTSDTENFPHQNARMRRLSGDIHIGQWPREDGIAYGIVFIYEGMTTYHQPDCHILTEEALTAAGITRDPEGFCELETLDQLEQVMRTYLELLDGDVRIDGIYRRVG